MISEMRQTPRILHILPVLGVAGAEQMAASLMVPLSRKYQIGAMGLYASMGSVTEAALRREQIPVWNLDKRMGPDLRMLRGIDRVFREFRPHVVHTHLHVLRYTLPAAIRRRIPVMVHTLHNLAEYESDTIGRWIQRVAFRRWVTPVAVSRRVAESMKSVYGIANAVTIPNGIPVGDFKSSAWRRHQWRQNLGFDQEAILFVATGRLTEQKNPLLQVQAFAEVNDPRCHLAFIGEGPLRNRVIHETEKLGLTGRIHLLGYRSDIRDCLSAADVFLLSSDWEGHPLGVMEAMATGLPVIATSVGGVPELVEPGRHGILVPAKDRAEMANAIRFLLERTDLRRAMGCAARERAQQEFSLDGMVQAYDDLYLTLLAARSSVADRPITQSVGD